MKSLGDLIEERLIRWDERDVYLRGKVNKVDMRSDARGIWTPTQATAQLARAQAVQRRKLREEAEA